MFKQSSAQMGWGGKCNQIQINRKAHRDRFNFSPDERKISSSHLLGEDHGGKSN